MSARRREGNGGRGRGWRADARDPSARPAAPPAPGSSEHLLQLQRTAGNAAVNAYLGALVVQRQAEPPAAPQAPPAPAPPSAAAPPPSPPAGLAPPATPVGLPPPAPPGLAAPDRPAPVPGPASERLQGALSNARAAVAELPELTLPRALSPGGQAILGTLRDAGQRGRETLTAAATAGLESTAAAAAGQAAQVDAAEAASTAAIHGHVEGARTQVSTAADEHEAALDAAHAAEQARLTGWHATAGAQAEADVASRQQAVTDIGARQAGQIRASGARASSTAASNMDAASQQARSLTGQAVPGGDAGAAGHAEVSDRLGRDAARQLDQAGPQVGDKLQAHAEEAAGELGSHAGRAAAAIGNHLQTVRGQLQQTVTGASAELRRAAGESRSQLRSTVGQVHQQLDDAGAQALDGLRQQAAQHREDLHTAAAEAAEGIHQQTLAAASAAQEHLSTVADRIAAAHVDETAAAGVTPELQARVATAYDTAAGQARDAGTGVAGHLEEGGRQAAGSLADIPGRVGPTLATAAQTAGANLGRGASQVTATLSQATSATMSGGGEALARTAQGLDQAVTRVEAGYTEAGSAAGRSLDEHVAEAGRHTSDAMAGLHGRVAEGQQRVDSQVAQHGQAVQRSILGAIGGWFAQQFRDLLDMLKSPSFWVGLVVTLVLFPFMGPGAFVVGGLAAGITAGIEQNVREGKAWYDPHNIIRDAFIGTVAGAAMAFGVGVIIGLGLEGTAAVLATMGLSAVIGIVINLVNGDRWDKGLLANLFLAWLFHRLAGGKAPEGEVPPEGGEQAPGGRTTTKVPGVYEGIDPAHAPQGWQFSDTVTTSGGETVVTTDVTAPDGSTGTISRGRVAATGEFVMHMAFLDGIPAGLRWIQTDPAMVPGRGTPLETYLTMRQMRILETQQGGGASTFAGPRTVRMSTIINVRTVLQLAVGAKSMPLDQAALGTNSVEYGSNSIIQSGGRIAAAHVAGGHEVPASTIGATPEQMAQFGPGIGPNDLVLYGFDIVLDVVPADAPAQQGPGNLPPAPPVHVPGQDQDDNQ